MSKKVPGKWTLKWESYMCVCVCIKYVTLKVRIIYVYMCIDMSIWFAKMSNFNRNLTDKIEEMYQNV